MRPRVVKFIVAMAPSPSRQLAGSYREQCELLNVSFLDADAIGCEFNTVDFMHLTSRGHHTLAEKLAKLIPQLVK